MPPEDTPDENDRRQAESRAWTSRRRFLEATGVAGLAGVGGFAFAQQSTTTYEFGGEVAGWQGLSPTEIEGETNPALTLEAGAEYEIVWENLDGAPHDFVVQDADGEELVGTDVVSEQGATASLTFTATEEMAQYVCTIHPASMVGDVEIEATGTPAGETDTPQPAGFVPEGPTVGARLVADGPLTSPVTLRTVPGMEDGHVVVDQAGQIYLLQGGELRDEPLLDVGATLAVGTEAEGGFDRPENFDERGLLGLAFHPEFVENGRIYLRYSSSDPFGPDGLVGPGDREFPDDWDHVEVLSEYRMTVDDGEAEIDPGSERVLLEIPSPQFNHNGGEVTFGPDGYLYTSIGDGGGANDVGVGHAEDWYDDNEGGNAQNVTDNLLGSVLRIDVDDGTGATPEDEDDDRPPQGGDTPYAIPEDNPLVDTGGMDEIYAWGLRNPWRMSFDDGTLIAADVGQNLYEEVDVVENGGNYGWNVREGFHCFDAANPTEPPAQCPTTAPDEPPFDGQELRDPVIEYPHTYEGTSVGISITGGYVYRGDELDELSGRYVFGDWSAGFSQAQGRVFVATPAGEATTPESDGSPTATDDQVGTVTEETASADDQLLPSEQPWPYEEILLEGGEEQQLNRFINAFGRDADGNVYVLASRTGRIDGDGGEVYRLVPAGEGDELSRPEVETPVPEEGESEGAAGGARNETTNATAGVETNETTGGGTNETLGAETTNETTDTETNETASTETPATEET